MAGTTWNGWTFIEIVGTAGMAGNNWKWVEMARNG